MLRREVREPRESEESPYVYHDTSTGSVVLTVVLVAIMVGAISFCIGMDVGYDQAYEQIGR